jgi:nicotinamidase/pyrazinamidase
MGSYGSREPAADARANLENDTLKKQPSTSALVVVDVQNDFCPGGRLAVPDGDAVVPMINKAMDAFDHVVLTQDWHPVGHHSFASAHAGMEPYQAVDLHYGSQTLWPDHCVGGTKGADFHRDLRQDRSELVLRKGFRIGIDSYSAFYENDRATPTGLSGYLRERGFKRVVLCGLATDFCVRYSAIDARKEAFGCEVLLPACRGIDLEGSMAAAVVMMRAAGVLLLDTLPD